MHEQEFLMTPTSLLIDVVPNSEGTRPFDGFILFSKLFECDIHLRGSQ